MEEKNPLVSVIIPNYNHAKFLDARINSILSQTYSQYEIILLDDCSTDNSQEIIEKYRNNPHISCVDINSTNGGSPFAQWEKGFSYAQGEFIWIAESDDCCEPQFLQRIMTEFEKIGEQCVLCFCRSVKIDVDNNHIGEEGLDSDKCLDGPTFIRAYLSRFNYVVNASSAVFRKAVLGNVDRSYTQYRACGDWVFWIEISKNGKVAYVNSPLNYFRQHSMSTTALQTKSGRGEYELIQVFRHMTENGYIGLKELFHAKVIHIYSLRYGKQKGFYSKESEEDYIRKWNETLLVKVVVWFIHILQKLGISVTNW